MYLDLFTSNESGTDTDNNYAGELRYKDLRSLDEDINPHLEPSVIVRRHVVLFLLEPLRLVITSTHLMLIVPQGADEILDILDNHLYSIFSFDNKEETYDEDLKLGKIVADSSFEIKSYEGDNFNVR